MLGAARCDSPWSRVLRINDDIQANQKQAKQRWPRSSE